MRLRTAGIVLVVAVLFIAFATHSNDLGYALGVLASRAVNVFHG
jgi:hypothetical protein